MDLVGLAGGDGRHAVDVTRIERAMHMWIIGLNMRTS